MTDLELVRQSACHALATAILEIWPEGAIRCRPACGERLLLRCRSSPPHLLRLPLLVMPGARWMSKLSL